MSNYLFLVSENQGILSNWDVYDSFVVCCASEDIARNTHPAFCDGSWGDDRTWVKRADIGRLDVKLLGVADAGQEEGVVIASFNAG